MLLWHRSKTPSTLAPLRFWNLMGLSKEKPAQRLFFKLFSLITL
jgi:hypothetical protein